MPPKVKDVIINKASVHKTQTKMGGLFLFMHVFKSNLTAFLHIIHEAIFIHKCILVLENHFLNLKVYRTFYHDCSHFKSVFKRWDGFIFYVGVVFEVVLILSASWKIKLGLHFEETRCIIIYYPSTLAY